MPQLKITRGAGKTSKPFVFEPERDSIVSIGRHPSNDIALKDPRRKISRHHAAVIRNQEGQYFIQDLGSTNGIEINGVQVFRGSLQDGDSIRIGNTYLVYNQTQVETARTAVPIIPEKEARNQQQPGEDYLDMPTDTHYNINALAKALHARYQSAFKDIAKRLHMEAETCQILQDVLDAIGYATEAARAYIAMLDTDGTLWVDTTYNIDIERGDEIPGLARSWIDRVIDEERPYRLEHVSGKGLAFICAPLWTGHRLSGLIYLGCGDKGFTEDDVTFINLVAEEARDSLKQSTDGDPTLVKETGDFSWDAEMIGNTKTKCMQPVLRSINTLAPQDSNILLLGETGAGKEVAASRIHALSSRADKPFIALELSAIASDEMAASALFGHVKGAFTGADQDRQGRFEAADSGTLFLDEIGDISLETQARLRRAIENKEIAKVGEAQSIKVDTRIIAATNCNLKEMIKSGEFREDVFERLGTVIELPPLRERKEDIPLLAHFFIAKVSQTVKGLSPKALQLLLEYDWPRNIRELRNCIEEAVVNAGTKELIYPWDLPDKLLHEEGTGRIKKAAASLQEQEYQAIMSALDETNWNIAESARILEVSRQTLYNKIKNNRIEKPKSS